nr:methylmalonyl-CoA mutase family protein [Jannaschia sp. LMIT008]
MEKDRPRPLHTRAGHSTERTSNASCRRILAEGQTGRSVAFDLSTQAGYSYERAPARGEVGIPVCHLGDMRTSFWDIPLDRVNTSQTGEPGLDG